MGFIDKIINAVSNQILSRKLHNEARKNAEECGYTKMGVEDIMEVMRDNRGSAIKINREFTEFMEDFKNHKDEFDDDIYEETIDTARICTDIYNIYISNVDDFLEILRDCYFNKTKRERIDIPLFAAMCDRGLLLYINSLHILCDYIADAEDDDDDEEEDDE